MENDPSEYNVLDVIRQTRNPACPACGEPEQKVGQPCSACGVEVPSSEDDDPVNLMEVVAGLPTAAMRKVPLEEAANLMRVRQAYAGVKDSTLTLEQYQALVGEVHYVAHMGVELFKSDVVKKRAETLPPNEVEVGQAMSQSFTDLKAATTRMLKYAESKNLADAEEGLRMAEAAFRAMDEAQDRALAIADKRK